MEIFQHRSIRYECLTGCRVQVEGQDYLEAMHNGRSVAVPLRGVEIWLKAENHIINWAEFSVGLGGIVPGYDWRTATEATVVTVVDGGELVGEFILQQGWMAQPVGSLIQLQAPLESEAEASTWAEFPLIEA